MQFGGQSSVDPKAPGEIIYMTRHGNAPGSPRKDWKSRREHPV